MIRRAILQQQQRRLAAALACADFGET